MDEELFEEDASGFGEGNDAVEETTVEEAPAESGYEASETFENVPEEVAPTTESTYTTSESESSPYEWITADWNTFQTEPTPELTQQLESTAAANATSGNEFAQSMTDLFGDNFQILDGPKKVSAEEKEAKDAVIDKLTKDVNEIISQYPTFDQDKGYGRQLQEVAPTKDQMNAAKERGFNKDYYEYAVENTTPWQEITGYGPDDGYAYGWGTYNGEFVPLAQAQQDLKDMEKWAKNGNEDRYNSSKENFYKSIETFQELKAYTSVWNEDGTLAPSTDDKQKARDVIAKTYLDNRNNLASAMQSFIDNPNKETYSKYNEALKTQNDETYKAADAAIADVLNKADRESSEWAKGIMAQDPLHNEELLEAFTAAEQAYFDAVKDEKEKARLAQEKTAKEREAASSMDKVELARAFGKGEISRDVYNERMREIKSQEDDEFNKVMSKGLENLTTQELSDYFTRLVSGIDPQISSAQWENLYDKASKREMEERFSKSKEMKSKAETMLTDEDKTNDLAALNLLNDARNTSGIVSFSNNADDITYTNPTTGEIETKSPDVFLREVLDSESDFNKAENWSAAVDSAMLAAQQAGLSGNTFLDYLQKVDPTLAQFLRAVFVDDWDKSNTASGQQYIEATDKLKAALSEIWDNKETSFLSKVWDSIKNVVSTGKEYRDITKDTQMYKLIKSAQTMVTRGIAVAVSAATGMPLVGAALYVASVTKGIIADRLKKMGYDDASRIMGIDTEEKGDALAIEPTTKSVAGKMISKAGAEPAAIDYKGYNKGLEGKEVARKDVPSDVILKVFKKEPKTFAWIRNV